MTKKDLQNQDQQKVHKRNFIDQMTIAAMQSSRRGFLSGIGKVGIVLFGGGLALESTPAFAATHTTKAVATTPDVGCPECWGDCSCTSSVCIACTSPCTCVCLSGCGGCTPAFQRAHLLWILGYIPNCTCTSC
jgi:hypothetical protein